jgi:hypothetical protein
MFATDARRQPSAVTKAAHKSALRPVDPLTTPRSANKLVVEGDRSAFRHDR